MLHAGEGMLHAGPHASVLGVVGFLAGQERAAGPLAVRDDESGVDVGAVTEHGHVLAYVGRTGVPPRFGIRGVAGHRTGRSDHELGVGVNDDLHVRREAVVA